MATRYEQMECREQLIRDIKSVAREIGYKGRGDTRRLAREMDKRGIRRPNFHPWWGGRWYEGCDDNLYDTFGWVDPAGSLVRFVKRYLPDLWKWGARVVPAPRCLCSKCPLQDKAECERGRVLVELNPRLPLPTPMLPKQKAEGPLNIGGWSVQLDKRGFYKVCRRINGAVKSVYLGKTLDGAEQKITAWLQSYEAERATVDAYSEPLDAYGKSRGEG